MDDFPVSTRELALKILQLPGGQKDAWKRATAALDEYIDSKMAILILNPEIKIWLEELRTFLKTGDLPKSKKEARVEPPVSDF